MKLNQRLLFITALLASLFLAGCAKDFSSATYEESHVGAASQVLRGVIVDKRIVTVKGESGVGMLAGGATGAIIGSNIGQGRGQMLGTLGGALAAGVAGKKIDEMVNTQNALEYIIKLNNGQSLAVVQGLEPQLQVGQRVIVLQGPRTRVVGDYSGR